MGIKAQDSSYSKVAANTTLMEILSQIQGTLKSLQTWLTGFSRRVHSWTASTSRCVPVYVSGLFDLQGRGRTRSGFVAELAHKVMEVRVRGFTSKHPLQIGSGGLVVRNVAPNIDWPSNL